MDYLSSRADENVPQLRVRMKNSPQEQNYQKPTFASLICAAHRPGANSRVNEARVRNKRSNVTSSSSPVSLSVPSFGRSRSVQRESRNDTPKRRRSHSQNQRRVTHLDEVERDHERLHVKAQKQHRPFLLSTVVPQISYSATIHLDPFTSTCEATNRTYNHRKWVDILKSSERSSYQSYEKFGYVMSSSTFDEGVLLSESLNGRSKDHHEEYLEMLMSVDRGSEVRNLNSASASASASSEKDVFHEKEHSSRFSSIGNNENTEERSGSVSRNQMTSYDRSEYADQTHSLSSGHLESKIHSTPKSSAPEKNGFTPETVNTITKSHDRSIKLMTPEMLNIQFFTPHTQWSESVVLNETDSHNYGNRMTKTLQFSPNTIQQYPNTINESRRKDGNICDISEIREARSYFKEQMEKNQNSNTSPSEYGTEINKTMEKENINAGMEIVNNRNKLIATENKANSVTFLSNSRFSSPLLVPLKTVLLPYMGTYVRSYKHVYILLTGWAEFELIGSGRDCFTVFVCLQIGYMLNQTITNS